MASTVCVCVDVLAECPGLLAKNHAGPDYQCTASRPVPPNHTRFDLGSGRWSHASAVDVGRERWAGTSLLRMPLHFATSIAHAQPTVNTKHLSPHTLCDDLLVGAPTFMTPPPPKLA